MTKNKIKIPEGWKEVKLNDVVEKMKTGGTPPSSVKEYYEGNISFVKIDDMTSGGKYVCKTKTKINEIAIKNSSAWIVPEYSLLYSIYATVGEVSINTLPVATNQAIMGIIPDELKISRDYLYYYLVFLKNKISKFFKETTQKNLTSEIVKNLPILLPPFATQNKIAEILGAVDEEIEKVEQITVESENTKTGLMSDFFNLSIKGRKELKLGEICNFTTGKLNSNRAEQDGKYPFFTCSQDTFRINSFSFDCEAILLAGNNAAGIYSVKYYQGKFDAYQRTYVITVKDKTKSDYLYLKNFLEWQLNNLRKNSVGTSTKFLTIKLLLNLKISVPKIEEQEKIAGILLEIDNKILIYKKIKNNLIQLKKGLMADLLSGRVKL